MFLEDPQIDLPYSCHAMTRSWLVHGFADQGARLYVGETLASPSTLFHIDHHADHTHPESEARVGNLAHCAFSSAISGNVRIFGGNPLIWNYQSNPRSYGSRTVPVIENALPVGKYKTICVPARQRTAPSVSSFSRKPGYNDAITCCPPSSSPWRWL